MQSYVQTCIVATLLLFALRCAVSSPATAAEDEFAGKRSALDQTFAAELETLAAICDREKLVEQAKISRMWLIDRDPQRQYLFLTDDVDPHRPAASAPAIQRSWYRKFLELRRDYAAKLFQLAVATLNAENAGRSYRLLYEVVRQDPEHAEARVALGYRRSRGQWSRPEMRPSVKTSRIAHPLFGWAPRTFWRVETAHFQVTTNHSAKEGVALAKRLEMLRTVWRQLFFEYWSDETDLAAWLSGHPPHSDSSKKHRVVLFRDRKEYVTKLSRFIPGIEVSEGMYINDRETAYFYAGDETAIATWYHEATHQLFHESVDVAPNIGLKDNFWAVEAVALYMESLHVSVGYATTGGFDASRLQYARYRAFNDQLFVPLDELVHLGREGLQKDTRLRQLYSQSAGLAHFFIDGESGKYRKTFLRYLMTIYAGRESRGLLKTLLGESYDNIPEEYREFLNVTDEQIVRYLGTPDKVTKLTLGHTDVTDETLKHLASYKQLDWLDLAYTDVTDDGVQHLKSLGQLTQLNLEGTQTGDASMAAIGRLINLTDLDLSETNVTNKAIPEIARLRNIEILWLTGTAVDDSGLVPLRVLKNLQQLDVSRTKVTLTGYENLKQHLPKLQP